MKAILVIDRMPMSCGECPILNIEHADIYTYCWAINKAFTTISKDAHVLFKRPNDCPLKPLPTRPDVIPIKEEKAYVFGWNACLEEIEGEGNETD